MVNTHCLSSLFAAYHDTRTPKGSSNDFFLFTVHSTIDTAVHSKPSLMKIFNDNHPPGRDTNPLPLSFEPQPDRMRAVGGRPGGGGKAGGERGEAPQQRPVNYPALPQPCNYPLYRTRLNYRCRNDR